MAELSPMMRQYFEVKEKCKDSIVFFRLGDFYEMFYDDAILVSKELELTLTGRDCGQKERAPMCGIPYHSCEGYIARLVDKGYKIAICEQLGDPSARGIVKRDITRIITPGTVIEENMLDESKNNYICSMHALDSNIGICFCDVSTGDLFATSLFGKDIKRQTINELSKFSPREILFSGNLEVFKSFQQFINDKLKCTVDLKSLEGITFNNHKDIVKNQFSSRVFEEASLSDKDDVIVALSVLFSYLKETQKIGLERINTIDVYSENQFMRVDLSTRRNLELIETMRNKEKKGSLLWVLDKTKTAMGKRLIKTYIEQPLLSISAISKRQDAVEEIFSDIVLMDNLKENLNGVYDLERLMTRIVYGSANARELRSLCYTFSKFPSIKETLKEVKSSLLTDINNNIDSLSDIETLIDESIVDEPPVSVKDGSIIRSGYDEEIDSLRNDMSNGKGIIAELEAKEKEKTGITKLKISYNRVFGYYIEVPNSFKDKVPSEYIRKQTLANCERYITTELKEIEGRVLGAKDRSMQLEYELFCKIRNQVANNLKRVQKTARAIAKLDVLLSFAITSYENRYVKPKVNNTDSIILKDSRHPVVEALLKDSLFVPNDVMLDRNENMISVITGPNMAGKSTYMRQVAIIVLMAQIGCFVPASCAEIGVVDSIFTRVGASDDLASGQSTFMIEMMEVAQIMNSATLNSLIILDEIGRGTSTFDGMSIARAVVEFIADHDKLGAKTLFATHYHELVELESILPGVKNYNIAVKKRGDDITFLRRIVPGGTDDSYGIEVAKLAGVPQWIISRAKVILKNIEEGNSSACSNVKIIKEDDGKGTKAATKEPILSQSQKKILDKISQLDVNTLTPIESMGILFELAKLIKE